ncbi:acetyl-CoA hydrolase/transferase C-terminal domain-containing protein [Haloferax sp. YSMS24]|uniref:acetyl-CoA hydrolase/transferase C-terminal domain-containing protein n=1 Tax=Haloferax sp. YSMS24 TaxID=3388425 RepID=UPI00398CC8DA
MSTLTQRVNDGLGTESAESAASRVESDAIVCVSGFGSVGNPKAVPSALARDGRSLSLTIISGGSAGGIIDGDLFEANAVARRYTYQAESASRRAVNAREVAFQDRHIGRLGEAVILGELPPPDVAIVEAVAVGDGWFVPSTSLGHVRSFVEAAETLIVEVNDAQPVELEAFHDIYRVPMPPRDEAIPLFEPAARIGTSTVTFDPEKLVSVVETDEPDDPYEFRTPRDVDRAIADNLGTFLREEVERNPALSESVRLQFGVGSLGNALMAELGTVDFGDRDIIYFGEVIQDGLLDLIDADVLQSASATSLALSRDGQRRLFDDVDRYASKVVLRPASISNRAELIDRFGVIAVNSTLEVDLSGHANSTHLNGTDVLNGIGGSGDYCRNGMVSILTLASTTAGGAISRIVPMVPHVDHTEHDFGVVVTEHGVADLRRLAPHERATELIENCADPSFVDELTDYVEAATARGGHIPHDLGRALSWHRNWRGE